VTDQTPAPKRAAHHAVLGLRVTGGFLGGAELEFADGLNCLIGGRGAGKTTALEFLRFGLGLMPDPKVSPQRHRAIDGLVKANLGNGRLSIELRTKTGMRYTAGRAANESVQILNEAGTAVPITLDRDLIFGADVFSQNEIEEIASSPSAQLALLDRFQEEETLAISRDLEVLQRQLEQSSTDIRRLDNEIDDLRAKASELAVIEEKLKGLVEVDGPDATRINDAHTAKSARAREGKIPEAIIGAMQKADREINASTAGFHASIKTQFDSAVRDGTNLEVFRALEADAQAFAQILTSAATSIADATRAAEIRIKAHRAALAEQHALQEAEYRLIISKSEEQGGRSAERQALQASLTVAFSASKDQQAKESQRQALITIRTDLLNRASEIRDDRFALRKRVAERLTQQFSSIRVTVTQAAELQQYRDLVADALKGAGVKHGVVAERLSQHFLPTELAHVVATSDHKALMQRANFDEERAKKIVDALKANGTFYAIETVDLDDRPCIELLDGDKYKESSNLSTGQRCTTILPILLVQSERPLLVDQPEDNLDNAFVYDTIVKALRAVKGDRQVIFVTHNPNIPVLGHAERVFVFGSDGQHSTLRQVGSVDECKVQIERILEGGREAFLERKARYGH
jgi:DNA repair ATPase RecN